VSNPAQIKVELISTDNPLIFSVVVVDRGGQTQHQVTIERSLFQQLSSKRATPEVFMEATFRFLLDREPKEAIMSRFNVTVIPRYFPEYPHKIAEYFF
jgi:hypothetical protein